MKIYLVLNKTTLKRQGSYAKTKVYVRKHAAIAACRKDSIVVEYDLVVGSTVYEGKC